MELFGTLGPACEESSTLEAMFRRGMTGLRQNLSHVTLPQAARQIEAVHAAADRCGVGRKESNPCRF